MNDHLIAIDEQFLSENKAAEEKLEHNYSMAALIIIGILILYQIAINFSEWKMGEDHMLYETTLFCFLNAYLYWYIKYISNKLLFTKTVNIPIIYTIAGMFLHLGYEWLMDFNTYLDEDRIGSILIACLILGSVIWMFVAIFLLKKSSISSYLKRWAFIFLACTIGYRLLKVLFYYLTTSEISFELNLYISVLAQILPLLVLAYMILKEPQMNIKVPKSLTYEEK